MQNIYKIKRAFLIPFSGTIVLLFLLFGLSLFTGQAWEKIILAVLCVIILAIGVEAARREIIVNEEGLKIKKFCRVKNFTKSEARLSYTLIPGKDPLARWQTTVFFRVLLRIHFLR